VTSRQGRSLLSSKFQSYRLLLALEGMLSRWSRLHLQSLAPINPRWARVVSYNPFSCCVIHKEGLCPSNRDFNRLMIIMMINKFCTNFIMDHFRSQGEMKYSNLQFIDYFIPKIIKNVLSACFHTYINVGKELLLFVMKR
jgi:hypothetical protein